MKYQYGENKSGYSIAIYLVSHLQNDQEATLCVSAQEQSITTINKTLDRTALILHR